MQRGLTRIATPDIIVGSTPRYVARGTWYNSLHSANSYHNCCVVPRKQSRILSVAIYMMAELYI